MLSVTGLSKTYPNGTLALSNATLEIRQGEVLALVGGSGCGKTTLLRLLCGLENASHGQVMLLGEAIVAPHPDIGIIFQEPRLLPWLSVAENIGFGIAGLPAAERRERVESAILRVGLAGYGGRWPRELSGGQAQRVAIARALVAKPKVLLLDEPFSALDAFTRADLQDHVLALWESGRQTLVLVTHDVEEAVFLADRVVVMQPRPGRIFAQLEMALPRPRDRLSDDFLNGKRRVLAALNGSLAEQRTRDAPLQAIGGMW
jgi:sulfonate transport system ATP-binding protein